MSDRETSPYRRIAELERENQLLRDELNQQAICNGAGASRELALRSTIAELQRENLALRSALTPWLAWEDTGGDIPPSAARELFRIARAAIDAGRKEKP